MEFDSILSLYVDKRAEHRWGAWGVKVQEFGEARRQDKYRLEP
jgi:hypothetical protein